MGRGLPALAAATALLLPATATGHSLVRVGGPVVSYLSADATSLNELTVRAEGGRVELRDEAVDGGIDPGTCTPGNANAQGYVTQVFCPLPQRVRIDLGDREDTATILLDVPVTILAGTGADRVTGGSAGDEIEGGPGNDELDGGGGDDRIDAADGGPDTVRCGPGNDSVAADAVDTVDPDCETVSRADAPPPGEAPAPDVPGPPELAVGAAVLQGGDTIRVYATAGEPATLGASGFLDAAGLELPIERLPTRAVTVGGGGVVLEYRLRGRLKRAATRALTRKRKVFVRLGIVATDATGASRRRDAPRIRVLKSRDRALAARHPEPGDVDGDEIRDEVDNCPDDKNGSQIDTDGDGRGDACDDDDDGDGVPDATDNCRVVANPAQVDTDGDGYGDECPPVDSDGDGVIDTDDNCDYVANPDQSDLDGDDKGDACDSDRDGDKIDDRYDNCPDVYNLEPTDVDGNGHVDDQTDYDDDGIGTACDPDESTVTAPPAATPAPSPTPVALTARTTTPKRQRARVVGSGPIVSVTCNTACEASTAIRAGTRTIATGTASLAGAGTTYVFTRFRTRVRRATRATVTTTVNTTVLERTIRLRP